MTRKKSRPHHREKISTEFQGYKMLWSSIENDENTVQRVPSPTGIPERSHPVATMVDSGDDSRDGNSEESNQMIEKIQATNSSTSQPLDRRISSDNSLDEDGNFVQNLLGHLNSKPSNAQLAAILPSTNSSTPPSQLSSPSHSDPAPEHASENFPTVNGPSENGSSAENTQFSDLNLSSPRSVQPLVELSDLTPLLGNSPQSPNREEPPQDVETPAENPSTDAPDDALDAHTMDTVAKIPLNTQNLDSSEKNSAESEELHASQLQVEPSSDECPPMISTLEPPQDQAHPEAQGPAPSPSDPCRTEDNVGIPESPESPSPLDDQESRTDGIEETQVRSPLPSEMHEDGIDVNKLNPDPMDVRQSDDDESNCANDEEVAPSPVPLPTPLASTTTGQALNLLRAMLVSNDEMDFSDFSCIEPLGPDFDPSNVNFLTHSEINKEMSADQSSSLGAFKEKEDITFSLPAASLSKQNVFDDEFPKCTNFLPTLMKVEPEYKSVAKACFDDFLECILEDSGLFTMADTDKISSESSDVDSIGDGSIEDSDSADIDRCRDHCQVIVERMPSSLIRTDHVSLSNKRYVAWRTNFAKERNEELFRDLKVWRKGRLLLWRECELAGMDRETYDKQVEFVKQHKIEISCSGSETSDSEDVSVDSGILPTCQISSDSSDSEIAFDFEESSVPRPPPVVRNILQKPRPKSKKLEFQSRQLPTTPQESSKEEYFVERNLVNESKDSNERKPPSALKITIRKSSITKSDDEIEGPVEREISSDDDVPLPLPVVKKMRRVAMKRTTRRVRSPALAHEPVPPLPSSSTDDEFPPSTLSPNKTSPPDSIRKKKSYFVDESENDGSLLGRRADEVENHNLLERFNIPFEEPTLFRSPRMASKLAQLKNKEAFKSTIKHSKAPKVDPLLKDVKMVVDELVLKTVEAILTQPRSRFTAVKKPTSEDLNPKSIIDRMPSPPRTLEASGSSKTEEKPCYVAEPVEREKSVPIVDPGLNEDSLTEISSSVSASLKGGEKPASSLHAGKKPENAIFSTKEFTVSSTHPPLSDTDPMFGSQSSLASEREDSEAIEPAGVVDTSDMCDATTTCRGETQSKEPAPKDQPTVEKRATRARQPNIEVDLDLIETLCGKRKKPLSSNKKRQKIAESPDSFLETADGFQKSDQDKANDLLDISADDSVTTTSKAQTGKKKKRRRVSRFARKRPQKPLSEEIVKGSNSEGESEDNVSKSLVQVAEISEGQGSEQIPDPSPVPSSPEPQFTRRVLRSHPRSASLKSLSTPENVDPNQTLEKVNVEENVEPPKDVTADLSPSLSSSSPEEPNKASEQPCDLKPQSADPEFQTESSKTSAIEVQEQEPSIQPEPAIEELPEISENLNLETEGDDETVLDDWHSVGSPVSEVDNILEAASKSNKNARDESSILFDALLASSFNKNTHPSQTSNSETLSKSLPNASSQDFSEITGFNATAKLQQPNEENVKTPATTLLSKDNEPYPATNEFSEPLSLSGNDDFSGLTIDQMTKIAEAMEKTGETDMAAGPEKDGGAVLANNQQSLLSNEEQLDFSSLSNILNMADSAEDLIIDQPFSDEEPEQTELNDCIIDIIQNHIVVVDSPTKDKNVVNAGVTKDSAKSQPKDDSIDERTGLPTTLIQRLRDPRIRSKVMSQLEGGDKIVVPQLPVQSAPPEPPPAVDIPNTPIELKDSAPKTVENVIRDPRALRSGTMVTRSCTEAAQKAQTSKIPSVGGKELSGNQDNSIASAQSVAQTDTPAQITEDSGQPAVEEEDEEEEALKRRPKKAKKIIDTELMYKSPLEDLEKEPVQSYGRNLPRRYSKNDPRPRGYNENRSSRWDIRNAAVKTGPQESPRHPDLVQMPPLRSQPLIPSPALHVHNQHNWVLDQNADCLPSYVESPQWQGNWMNEQPFSPIDRRKAWMAGEIAALQREPKTVDMTKSAIRKPVLRYIKNAFKDILPNPPFDLNLDDKEVVISMMDPFGQEIDMVQLPRPTAKLTKAYLAPASNYKSIEEMVSNPSLTFSQYMDEEKVDELVLDFFDEEDAEIVRMQSHVPTKRAGFLETEPSKHENCEEKTDKNNSLVDKVDEETKVDTGKTEVKSSKTDIVEPKDSAIPGEKLIDESSNQNTATKKPKVPQPPGKMEFLDIILHHLPILKEQYSFKTTPLKAPDSPKSSLTSGPSTLLSQQTPAETPSSPSPPSPVKANASARNPSPPRIMKALLNLSKSERLGTRRNSKRSRSTSRSPPPRKRSRSPAEYRRRRRRSPSPARSPSRRSPVSRRKRSPDYRRRALTRRSRSPKRYQRSNETSSECSTPRYSRSSRSSRSPSPPSSRRRRARRSSSSRSSSPAPLPKAYRRSWTRSPSGSYRSRSISKSPPRKRYSKR